MLGVSADICILGPGGPGGPGKNEHCLKAGGKELLNIIYKAFSFLL